MGFYSISIHSSLCLLDLILDPSCNTKANPKRKKKKKKQVDKQKQDKASLYFFEYYHIRKSFLVTTAQFIEKTHNCLNESVYFDVLCVAFMDSNNVPLFSGTIKISRAYVF